MDAITTFRVLGMSCGHCEAAVTQELSALDGVASVEVDLDTGNVTVSGDVQLDRDAIAGAIDEAGYELAP